MIVFILRMPNVGLWNNKLSGPNRLYYSAYCNNFVPKSLVGNTYYYDFGDGQTASIEVKEMPYEEARKMEEKSHGFYGRDWMIKSLIKYGEIKALNNENDGN